MEKTEDTGFGPRMRQPGSGRVMKGALAVAVVVALLWLVGMGTTLVMWAAAV